MSNTESYDFADSNTWPTPRLRTHIRELILEKEVSIAHKAERLERTIGHGAFELYARAHVDTVDAGSLQNATAGAE